MSPRYLVHAPWRHGAIVQAQEGPHRLLTARPVALTPQVQRAVVPHHGVRQVGRQAGVQIRFVLAQADLGGQGPGPTGGRGPGPALHRKWRLSILMLTTQHLYKFNQQKHTPTVCLSLPLSLYPLPPCIPPLSLALSLYPPPPPALGHRLVDQLVLVALSGHVAPEAEERGDVDSVDVLRVLHVAAQVELGEDALRRLLLSATNKHAIRAGPAASDQSGDRGLRVLTSCGELKVTALGTS